MARFNWVQNPYLYIVDPNDETPNFNEELIDIQNNTQLKQMFTNTNLIKFWTDLKNNKTTLWDKAKAVILPFPTQYTCEARFSQFAAMKNNSRNRLDVEHPLRVALSTIEPRITILSETKR
jgi:hypothetical protein